MDPAVRQLQEKVVKLEGDIKVLKAEKKALERDIEHERKAHALELENLQLKMSAIVSELENELDSRTPILSKILRSATQMTGDLERALSLLPPPDQETDK